jgi:hypothetical protein
VSRIRRYRVTRQALLSNWSSVIGLYGINRDRTKLGSQSRTRTCNLAINSRLLCQLSYLGMNRKA